MLSCTMPVAPVEMRSPRSTAVPRTGVTRWPFAFVTLTSPTTKVNSPLAACTRGAAAIAARKTMRLKWRSRRIMASLSSRSDIAAHRGCRLVAVEFVRLHVGVVAAVLVLQAQGAGLAELPRKAGAGLGVVVVASLHVGGAREVVLVAAIDDAEGREKHELRVHRVLQVAARAKQVLALGRRLAVRGGEEAVRGVVVGHEAGEVEQRHAPALEALQPRHRRVDLAEVLEVVGREAVAVPLQCR